MRKYILLLSFMLSCCAGYKDVTYFAPVPQSNVRVFNTFRGLSEIAEIQTINAIKFSLILFDRPDQSTLKIIFNLPEAVNVRFVDDGVIATSPSGDAVAAKITSIQGNYVVNGRGNLRYSNALEELQGGSYEYPKAFGGKAIAQRLFEIEIDFPQKLSNEFQLKLPNITLSGQAVSFPVVIFKRRLGSAYQGSAP